MWKDTYIYRVTDIYTNKDKFINLNINFFTYSELIG